MTRQPKFWYEPVDKPSLRTRLLSPFGGIYARATARRVNQKAAFTPEIPVICVGNISIGGAGKTPTTIALLQKLLEQNAKPIVVTKGYGGKLKGTLPIDATFHSAEEVGDEPLLLSAFAPVIKTDHRPEGAKLAQKMGATHILLDDGFQDQSLFKHISILVIDAKRGFGNGRSIPAGPLREPVTAGLKRADCLFILGTAADRQTLLETWPALRALPQIHGRAEPINMGYDWAQTRVFAFAGIAFPEKFFQSLRDLGAHLVATEQFPDHRPFSETILKRLEKDAQQKNAILVTTEKDAIRLSQKWRQKVLSLPVRLNIEDWAAFDEALKAQD